MVVLLKAGVRRPEGARLDTLKPVGEDAQVGVPAADEAEHGGSVLPKPTVGQNQQHLVTLRTKFKGDLRSLSLTPGKAQQVGRFATGNKAGKSVPIFVTLIALRDRLLDW